MNVVQAKTSRVCWITGAAGLLGAHLLSTASRCVPNWRVTGLTRSLVDLEDFSAVGQLFARQDPDLIIHCAALSRSPACQENPALARRLNIDVTRHLAELAERIPFIFFSSDLVFDGRQGNYDESGAPHPLSVYADTKVAAEKIVAETPGTPSSGSL